MTLLRSTQMFAIGCVLSFSQQALQAQVTIDGAFEDWAAVPVLASSPTPDGGTFDIHELKVTNDEDNYYFYVSLHDTVGVDMSQVRISIDTDNSTATGHDLNLEFPSVPAGTVGVDLLVTNDFPVLSTAAEFWGAIGGIPPYGGGFISVSTPTGATEREWCIPRALTLNGNPVFGDSFTVSAWTWESDVQATTPTLYNAVTLPPYSNYMTATIDGDTSEWAGVPVFATDAVDNAGSIDFTSIQIANDENFIYVRYLVNEPINFVDDFSGVYKSVDEDDDVTTGFDIFTLGVISAEASWQGDFPFENATGVFNTGNGLTSTVNLMSSLQLLLDPGTSTLDVEFAIDRSTIHTVGGANVFPVDGEQIAFALWTDQGAGDLIGGGAYTLAAAGSSLIGDFDTDGDVDVDDIDFYAGNIGAAATGALAQLDLTGDGQLTLADLKTHVETYVQTSNGETGTFLGDLNLDGSVNVLGDAFALIGNLNNPATSYGQGDLNLDGTVNVLGDAFTLIGNLNKSNAP